MDEPKPLDSLFKEKIFRIPDYQRGYAWQREQLKAFWEDLLNLSSNRSHYTGVLTLKEIPARNIADSDKEFWLVDDHSYRVYHVVDGQQRLTTFIIFLQALVDFFKALPENKGKPEENVYISESLSLAALQSRYLFKIKPTGDEFRTYKFGYTQDNPSYNYLRFQILGEDGGGFVQETFYTLNLSNAKTYFTEQLRELHREEGITGLQEIYKKLTKRFLFNEYVIKDDFDVFVAFETMNNRGKKLSDLELLKNRLIYLTTLYTDDELDAASRKNLRDTINDAWKEVYHQLGRNKSRPLNDDDFLRAHWTMYFKYSRQTGRDYIRFLLDEQFTPQNVHKKIEREVVLEIAEEQRYVTDILDFDDADIDVAEEVKVISSAQLQPIEIRDFVNSLKESAVHWFNSFYPDLAEGISENERLWIDRLNRVGMVYFRPLIMAILKNEPSEADRIRIFQRIERFIFIAFRTTSARANYRSSEFYNAARALDRKETTLDEISKKLDDGLSYTFNDDGTLRDIEFYNILRKKFENGSGYYGWSGLRYFLYEYEISLLSESRHKKIDWSDLLKTENDKISIEHIYPQTETDEWANAFIGVDIEKKRYYNATLGNLLLLSASINSSLQNDIFVEKKKAKYNAAKEKVRNGYSDGSHSEIEVSQQDIWGPEQINDRGIKLLSFMEKRWDFKFKDNAQKNNILFLNFGEQSEEIHQQVNN
ncbi:DUF262 domain-containing protein [Methylomonas sp. 11b]|uniref:DUF262 domain-containing protein n=1 Tax=Methylomonas sp. 11b TaxID=1168169 RepID=UPI00047CBC3E|nr:DUF262 domain-containing protein [Methylomonas sp. 11b]OQW66781.1 MAG: hypothetical protein BVN35_21285 [Proteobacteria bacterium ST_bin11]